MDGSTDRAARWLDRAATAWLCLVTVRYLGTLVGAVTNPPNPGADLPWAAALLAAVAAIALTHWRWPTSRTTRLWLIAMAIPALSMIVLSGHLPSVAVAGWLLVAAWMAGNWILIRFGLLHDTDSGLLAWSVIAVPVGLTAVASMALALGAADRLTPRWIAAALTFLTVAAIPAARRRVRTFRDRPRVAGEPGSGGSPQPALLGLLVLLDMPWMVAPEVQFDALNYHLAVPRVYVEAGGLVDQPYFWHSYYVQLAEMLFALALALAGPVAVKTLALTVTLLAACGTYLLGTRLFSKRVGLWSATLFFATPLVSRMSTTADVDLWAALMLVAVWISFTKWRETGAGGWLWATGLLAGAAVGVRVTTVYGLSWVGLVILGRFLRPRLETVRPRPGDLAAAAVAALAAALPWFLPRLVWTGNPVFPFLDRRALEAGPAPPVVGMTATEAIPEWDPSYLHWIWSKLFIVPWWIVYGIGGVCGIGLFILLPFGLRALRRRPSLVGSMLSVCLAYLLVWSTILVLAPQAFPHVRLFIPVIPLVLILGLPTLLEVPAGRWQARLRLSLACVILAAQVAFIPTQFWHIPERIPVRRAIGLETDDQLLSRSLAPYDAVRFLNGLTGPGDRIVAVGVNDVRYYVDAPMAPAHLMPLLHDLDATLDDEGVRRLRNEGYGYLLVDRRYVPGRQADCTNPFCSETHLGRYTTPLYSRKGVTLYRIDDRPVALEPPANMLTNPGFEDLEPAGLPSGWRPYGRPRVMRNPGRDRSGAVIVAATREDGLVQRVPVTAGALYRLSHFVRTEGTSQVARLQINWLDTNRRFVEAAIQTMTARREWQPGRMLATAPDRAAWADVYVSAHAGGRVWFDDFELVRLDDRAPSDDPGS